MFRARKHSRQQYLMNSRNRGISLTDRRGASRSRTPGALPGIMGEPGAEHTAPQEGRFTVPSQGGILGEAAGRAAGGNPPQGTSRPGKMEAHDQTEPQSQRPCEMAMTAVTGLWGDGDGGGVMGAWARAKQYSVVVSFNQTPLWGSLTPTLRGLERPSNLPKVTALGVGGIAVVEAARGLHGRWRREKPDWPGPLWTAPSPRQLSGQTSGGRCLGG